LQHSEISGLYPCGEGAGFAGGIVSAALDGMRCAEAAAESRGYTSQDRRAPEPTTTPSSQVKPQLSP